MQFFKQQAYRLGSMPYRVFKERCRADWPAPARTEAALSAITEWSQLLTTVREKSLVKDVEALRNGIEAERQSQGAVVKREKLEGLHDVLRELGENPEPLSSTPPLASSGSQSYELARDLVERALQTNLRDRLPRGLQEAFDLGVFVGRGVIGALDERGALFIWTVLNRCGVESWITGRPAGTPLGPRQSVYSIVLDRLSEIDAMLSREGLPGAKTEESPELLGPYLTIQGNRI